MNDRMQQWYQDDLRGHEDRVFVTRGGHDGWFTDLVEILIVVLIVAALALAIVWLVRKLATGGGWTAATAPAGPAPATAVIAETRDPAVEVLRLRYARGEVSPDDFHRTLADLGGGPTESWPTPDQDTEPPA